MADWSRGLLYLYPPLALLARALHKVVREEAQVIAIIPWWPRRGWFPKVLQLLCDLPVMLPERDGLLSGVDGADYPDLHTLRLAAWRLSGDLSVGAEFRRMLQTLSAPPTGRLREICITPSGSVFVAGAVDGVRIPFIRLLEQC